MELEFPAKLSFLFDRTGRYRYKILHGGRGGLKSWSIAEALIIMAAQEPLRILCAREWQSSIRESCYQLLQDWADRLELSDDFKFTGREILHQNGSQFIFAGLRADPYKIKSCEGIDICWVEESQNVSNASWEMLLPTIRKPKSEIIISFNTGSTEDPTFVRFVANPHPKSVVVKTTIVDNKWASEELLEEMEHCKSTDYDRYLNIWLGEPLSHSHASVLFGKILEEEFTPGIDWEGPYFGADWGFGADPSTLVKSWISGKRLYIEKEFHGRHVEYDHLALRFSETIPEAKDHDIRGDCAQPGHISFLQRNGYPRMMGCTKWPGSVEDGVGYLRNFEKIVIHPRCIHALEEGRHWSYKVDRLTSEIKNELAPGMDHVWDAVRYSLQDRIKAFKGQGVLDWYRQGYEAVKKRQAEEESPVILPEQINMNGPATRYIQNSRRDD